MEKNLEKNTERVRELLDQPELFCQLAEECDELGKAALKLRRAITGINPVRMTETDAWRNLYIELADVMNSLDALQIHTDDVLIMIIREEKMERWVNSLEARPKKMQRETEGEA